MFIPRICTYFPIWIRIQKANWRQTRIQNTTITVHLQKIFCFNWSWPEAPNRTPELSKIPLFWFWMGRDIQNYGHVAYSANIHSFIWPTQFRSVYSAVADSYGFYYNFLKTRVRRLLFFSLNKKRIKGRSLRELNFSSGSFRVIREGAQYIYPNICLISITRYQCTVLFCVHGKYA
jgi:hypothetical protein